MNGFRLIAHSLRLFWKHPALLLPLFLIWIFYAPAVIYLRFYFPWQSYEPSVCFEVLFGSITAMSIAIVFSCTWLLEMLKAVDSGKKLNFFKAFWITLSQDLLPVLPIALIWAVITFILTIIEAMLSKEKNKENPGLTDQSVAETLAGFGDFSLSRTFFQALEKGIRMVVFLILPAIVWEGLDTVASIKKGIAVLRAHLKEFAYGFALTYAAAALIFLPAAIFVELGKRGEHGAPPIIQFSQEAWVGLIIYIGFCWSFCLYLEQMFGASLYLWHLKWEKASLEAVKTGAPPPLFKKIPPPYLLQTFQELQNLLPVFGMEDEHGRTTLHMACASGDIAMVESLLAKGADPGAQDAAGRTPLDYAAGQKHLDIVKLLVSGGAIGAPDPQRVLANDPLPKANQDDDVNSDLDAARKGSSEAMMRIAYRYKTGTFYPRDMQKYVAWASNAAEAGCQAAMEEMGSAYERGENVPRDPAQAAHWYVAAGTNPAMLGLIRLYRDGNGPRSEARAVFSCFLHAIEKSFDDPIATYGMGVMYRTGQGVPKDTVDADRCFKLAASRGFAGPELTESAA